MHQPPEKSGLGNARLVFTDLGGVQQEAGVHHVPCVTLRDNTELTEALAIGLNRLSSHKRRQ